MNSSDTNEIGEKLEKVVIDPKDTEIVEKFFQHFQLNIPDYLKQAIDDFAKDQTLDTQRDFKMNLTKAIGEMKDDFLKIDEIFEPVIMACDETSYNIQFDKDLAEVLSEEPEETKED